MRSITQTKQAGTLAAPWGMHSHSFESVGGGEGTHGDSIRVGDYLNKIPAKRLNTKKTKAATGVSRTLSAQGIVIG